MSPIEIDANDAVQTLAPPSSSQRFEGLGFSTSGNVLAVATSDTNTVYLFRRNGDGRFEDTPYSSLTGAESGLSYPHDVSFSFLGERELLAVAQRGGAVAIYEQNCTDSTFGPEPAFEIRGSETNLNFSDGVAFVPPHDAHLAVCNLMGSSISFYRRTSRLPLRFELEPVFELKHAAAIFQPDGLALSLGGRWLAVANHGNHTISIFQRRKGMAWGGKLEYGPEPVTIITDPGLRHPHSVAFTPKTNHLVVTNSGANYFSIYAPKTRALRRSWSQSPVIRKTIGPDSLFKEVNASNKMEGGPKGVAIHRNSLAICSPEHGVKIYSFRESGVLFRTAI